MHARTAGPNANPILLDLEKQGFQIINSPQTLMQTSNKFLAQQHAKENAIPSIPSFVMSKHEVTKIIQLLKQHKTLVIKPIYSQGQGEFCEKITFSQSEQEIIEKINQIPGDSVLVQQYIEYKKLIRTIVVGDLVLTQATVYDEPRSNWKCSVCLNPHIKKLGTVPSKLINLSLQTAKAFSAQISYIDFFETHNDEYVLNEAQYRLQSYHS